MCKQQGTCRCCCRCLKNNPRATKGSKQQQQQQNCQLARKDTCRSFFASFLRARMARETSWEMRSSLQIVWLQVRVGLIAWLESTVSHQMTLPPIADSISLRICQLTWAWEAIAMCCNVAFDYARSIICSGYLLPIWHECNALCSFIYIRTYIFIFVIRKLFGAKQTPLLISLRLSGKRRSQRPSTTNLLIIYLNLDHRIE